MVHGAKADRLADHAMLYRAAPIDRIGYIRQGISAGAAKRLLARFDLDQQRMLDALDLKTATVNRKAARGEPLAADESERVLGLSRLIGQVEAMVEEARIEQAGDAEEFDAPSWLSRWLGEPLPALGQRRPIDLLDTMAGQALVSQALARIEGGAYA